MTGGIILAAGLSSRMGSFKPLMNIGGTTFIKRIVLLMRSAGIKDIVVVTGYRRIEVENHLSDDGVIFTYNERFFDSQMLDSLRLGLKKIVDTNPDIDGVLVTPADAVLSQKEIYAKIAKSKALFARPVYKKKGGHPIYLSRRLFDSVISYREEGGLKGAVIASGAEIQDIEVDWEGAVMDADTADDYRKMIALYDKENGNEGLLHPEITLKLSKEHILFGQGFMQLMEYVDATGSLLAASEAMHISYTKVWRIIKYVESMTEKPLIIRETGGEDGGGSRLTEQGKELLNRYKKMMEELDAVSRKICDKYFSDFRI